jgi:hypothetical protein
MGKIWEEQTVALNIKPGLNENPTSLEFPSGRD